MTAFSKVLTVFTAVACLAFLAFVSATILGGPNWQAKLNDEDLGEAFIIKSNQAAAAAPAEAEKPKEGEGEAAPAAAPAEAGLELWQVTNRRTGANVGGQSAVLPEVIVTARRQLAADQEAELRDLDVSIKRIEQRLVETRQLIGGDEAAVNKRFDELEAELADLNAKIEALSRQGIQQAEKSQQLQAETTRRTEDVYRLASQLDQIRTETFQIQEQQRILRQTLVNIRGSNDRLQQRNADLKGAGAQKAKSP